jgi:hypothetical protein
MDYQLGRSIPDLSKILGTTSITGDSSRRVGAHDLLPIVVCSERDGGRFEHLFNYEAPTVWTSDSLRQLTVKCSFNTFNVTERTLRNIFILYFNKQPHCGDLPPNYFSPVYAWLCTHTSTRAHTHTHTHTAYKSCIGLYILSLLYWLYLYYNYINLLLDPSSRIAGHAVA